MSNKRKRKRKLRSCKLCKSLHDAAKTGHDMCLKALMAKRYQKLKVKGCTFIVKAYDLEETDANNYTPLMLAAATCHINCIKVLLKAEEDGSNSYSHDIINLNGRGPMNSYVAVAGNRSDCGGRGAKNCTRALTVAAAHDFGNGVSYLIQNGADATGALHLAVTCSIVPAVRKLTAAGANVNAPHLYKDIRYYVGDFHHSPLHSAAFIMETSCAHRNILIIKHLLSMRACVNELGCFAFNALATHVWHFLESYEHNRETPFCDKIFMLLFAAGDRIDGDVNINGKIQNAVDKMREYAKSRDEKSEYETNIKLDAKTRFFDDAAAQMRICIQQMECSSLRELTREAIRKHLLSLDKHTNLFVRIPHLGLPPALCEYMLYHTSLENSDNNQVLN